MATLVSLASLAVAVANPRRAVREPAALAPRTKAREASLPPSTPPANAPVAHVVLVTIDGVLPEDVLGTAASPSMRLMPRLGEMLNAKGRESRAGTSAGAIGRPGFGEAARASGPNFVSLPGYTEIFTGRPSSTCADNTCAQTVAPTVVDEVAARFGAQSVAVVASWQLLRRAATRAPDSLFVACGPEAPAAHAVHPWLAGPTRDATLAEQLGHGATAPSPLANGEYRPDAATAPIALHILEEHAPRFLFLGLGDTDEQAHLGDRAAYERALSAADAVLGRIREILDAFAARGEPSTLLVASDHGRASSFRVHGGAWPESGATFIAAYGAGVRAHGVVAAASPHRLADIAPTVRALLGLDGKHDAGSGAPLSELVDIEIARSIHNDVRLPKLAPSPFELTRALAPRQARR